MNTHKDVEGLIKQRYEALFLDIKTAQESAFNEGKPVLSVIEIEQSKTARSLLHVEKQAIREKDLISKSDLIFLNTITKPVYTEV
jgi:hypothetical protein